MQDVFRYDVDQLGDGRLSRNELLVFQFLSEVMRSLSCSASAVTGDASATGSTLVARNLEWISALDVQAGALHSVTTYRNGGKTVVNIGFLGQLGGLTVFNQHKVLGAVVNSTTGAMYPSDDLANRRSFFFDLREAFESFSTLGEISSFMKDPRHLYVYNHLILLADPATAGVVENQVNSLPGGADGNRSFRTGSSPLNPRLLPDETWGISGAFAAVNDFRLEGNDYTQARDNVARWNSYKARYSEALSAGKVDIAALKGIAGYPGPAGDGVMGNGAIFCSEEQAPLPPGVPVAIYEDQDVPNAVKPAYTTVQSIIMDMSTMELWVNLIPSTTAPPRRPTYRPIKNPIY
jgi:hypothetical protein